MRGTHQRSQRNNQLNNQRMASQRINQRNKTARNNATVKKDTQVSYYNKNFKNSPLLPYTKILAYMKTNFSALLKPRNVDQQRVQAQLQRRPRGPESQAAPHRLLQRPLPPPRRREHGGRVRPLDCGC